MNTPNIQLGLIGYPLEHTYSKLLHEQALQSLGYRGQYKLWEIPPEKNAAKQLKARISAVRKGEVRGMNVTIPHKKRIVPYLDTLSESAKGIGAVNTIYQNQEKGLVVGENTDAPAFWTDLQSLLKTGEKTGTALVLGAGGAARAVCYQLIKKGWLVLVAARNFTQAEELTRDMGTVPEGQASPLSLLEDDLPEGEPLQLVVNATSAGMHPEVNQSPWPAGWQLPSHAAVYDLVYNPPLTAFNKQAMEAGLKTKNGLGMLVEQAALAFEYWMDCPAPREIMKRAVQKG